jgi:hypothetical protein
MLKTYLGDSVYADVDKGMIKLTTENGLRATNTIFLEPEVYEALIRFADRAKAHFAELREKAEAEAIAHAIVDAIEDAGWKAPGSPKEKKYMLVNGHYVCGACTNGMHDGRDHSGAGHCMVKDCKCPRWAPKEL